MAQVIGRYKKPKRANIRAMKDTTAEGHGLDVLRAGEYMLVSSDNSMKEDGQGCFDSYAVGDGVTPCHELEIIPLNDRVTYEDFNALAERLIKFTGYVALEAPTGEISDGSLWFEGEEMPLVEDFPIAVKTYDAESGEWSEETTEYTPHQLDLWAELESMKGFYWFIDGWNRTDEDVPVDDMTIERNEDNALQLKDGDETNGVTFQKLNTHRYTDEVIDDEESLPLNTAVHKELLDAENSTFEYDNTDADVDKVKITLQNNNEDTILEKEIDFEDKMVFEKKEQIVTNKTIDADTNTLTNITGENVKSGYMVGEIGENDIYYGYTFSGDNVFTKTLEAGIAPVYNIIDKDITLLGDGVIAENSVIFDGVTYTRDEAIDDYYIDESNIKFPNVDLLIGLKKIIDAQKHSFQQVSTFEELEGDAEVLYYLDTAYDDYKVGFYLYDEELDYHPVLDDSGVVYLSSFEGVEGDEAYLYYLDTADEFHEVGFYRFINGDFSLIGSSTEVFTDVLQLPIEEISKDTIYRLKIYKYYYGGAEITEPAAYHVSDASSVVVAPTGITVDGTETAFGDLTDTYIQTLVVGGYIAVGDYENADFFRVSTDGYCYHSGITRGETYSLYHNPTETQEGYLELGAGGGGGGSVEIDNITVKKNRDERLQANAVIPVEYLPSANILPDSFYEIEEDVSYEGYEYRHNADVLAEAPIGYAIIDGSYVIVNKTRITINGVTKLWAELTSQEVDELVFSNKIEIASFDDSDFFGYDGGLFDVASKFSQQPISVSFTMHKLFKHEDDRWASHSVIHLNTSQYQQLTDEQRNDGTLYVVDDYPYRGMGLSYDILQNKPTINGITLQDDVSLLDLDLYSRAEVNNMLEGKSSTMFVDQLPSPTEKNTWYYSKKYQDGTAVPNDKRVLYITDKNNVLQYLGIVGEMDLEVGTTLSGSETKVTSSQVVKNALERKQDTLVSKGSYGATPQDGDYISGVFVDNNNLSYKSMTFANLRQWMAEQYAKSVSSTSTDYNAPTSKAVWNVVDTRLEKVATSGLNEVYVHHGTSQAVRKIATAIGADNASEMPTVGAVYNNKRLNGTSGDAGSASLTLDALLAKVGLTGLGTGHAYAYCRQWNSCSDKPWNADAVYLEWFGRDNSTGILRVTEWIGQRMAIRAKTNGSWNAWKNVTLT